MQTQPFVLDHLNAQRQSDLHAASLDVRHAQYFEYAVTRSRLVERVLALVSRRPSFEGRTGSAGAEVQPAAGR